MSLGLKPQSEKTRVDMIIPVDAILLKHQALNTLKGNKNPSNKTKIAVGVERTTDKTGGILLPIGTRTCQQRPLKSEI